MKKSIFLFLISFVTFIKTDHNEKDNRLNTEFIIKKKNTNHSPSKLRDLIIKNSSDLLKIDLNLDKFSIKLRSFLLNEIDLYFNDDDESFLANANRNQLQESLDELIILKNDVEKKLSNLENKLEKLKYKFKSLKTKDINGKLQ